MLKNKSINYKIFVLINFLLYVAMAIFLIVEAAMTGETSASQSNNVTEVIVEVVNTITQEETITNTPEVSYSIRKLIGHFSTFLVLGVFSSFFYLLVSNNRKIFIPINFAQGIALAFITEGIQLNTPGRYGALSDVMIDSSGFLASAIIITLIVLLIKFNKKTKDNTK